MPDKNEVNSWCDLLRKRYEYYLRASFYFKDSMLRESFAQALQQETSELMKGAFPESGKDFELSLNARELAKKHFTDSRELELALIDRKLYSHQSDSIQQVYKDHSNIVVATGTASGKTESFLYPIFFELFRQYQSGEINTSGVRALILYPMNALANDQRKRLGKICKNLQDSHSKFIPTFGQYIGETPENALDQKWKGDRYPGELVFREEMRKTPPNILLTNYSMLEYLLIRTKDSELFDNGNGKFWQFLVLDEAHQYRGTKGIEMAMLIRRLKQRIRDGGRGHSPFRCIATSATITSSEDKKNQQKVADFAGNLFDEKFHAHNVIFAKRKEQTDDRIVRYHTFMRALEGAFLIYQNGRDKIVLNRKIEESEDNENPEPLEIALCHECGQHYYVGRISDGKLIEAVRDPTDSLFGVTYLLPTKNIGGEEEKYYLCKFCGKTSTSGLNCHPDSIIRVRYCENHPDHRDRLKECAACGYGRLGNIGDPVSEIVHGSDGPNTVIATALHEKQCQNYSGNNKRSRILAFADSRQEAAFFAWYSENSFNKIRDRNFIWRALNDDDTDGVSIRDLQNRLQSMCDHQDIFPPDYTPKDNRRETFVMIYREFLTDDKRISLQGTGLTQWYFQFPPDFDIPKELYESPWNLSKIEAENLIQDLLMDVCSSRKAVELIEDSGRPSWDKLGLYRPQPGEIVSGQQGGNSSTVAWESQNRSIVKHYLNGILKGSGISDSENTNCVRKLLSAIMRACIGDNDNQLWIRAGRGNGFRVNLKWLRVLPRQKDSSLFECNTCDRLYFHSIKNVCPRNGCPGKLIEINKKPEDNHYSTLYQSDSFPSALHSEEHTAQLQSDEARNRQEKFENGDTNLLSSSTTFEVGVDIGDLETVFMRNVPPEPFNYTQRAGRAGRGGQQGIPGFVLTYCRRSPHDLYHFEDPEKHILRGEIRPPILNLQNEKIILRHITAVIFSLFFKEYGERFKNVESFVKNWEDPSANRDFRDFCKNHTDSLESILAKVTPSTMHKSLGFLMQHVWIDKITDDGSIDERRLARLAKEEAEICNDYRLLKRLEKEAAEGGDYEKAKFLKKRANTIAKETTLDFLSRKAIIPKYGFPVDVVELDTRRHGRNIALQRDLSQAIAEYAPSGRVVANKLEWESRGIKKVEGKDLRIYRYRSDESNRDFEILPDGDSANAGYIIPRFGFVTSLFDEPKEPRGRARRLFTTRPYFVGFINNQQPEDLLIPDFPNITVSRSALGKMVVLCKGKNGGGFNICLSCYAGFTDRPSKHKTPEGKPCRGTLDRLSLGHEFETDVVRLQFNGLTEQWDAYSLAYALLLGAAQTLQLPSNDLNATITGGKNLNDYAIVLYDNVPGGAGLVVNLHNEDILIETLRKAHDRMSGGCGCDSSCYGCLRSYRNQFSHSYLSRKRALKFLKAAIQLDEKSG